MAASLTLFVCEGSIIINSSTPSVIMLTSTLHYCTKHQVQTLANVVEKKQEVV